MKLVAKYLKPFILFVMISLVMLFGQAYCDLSLPNIMSDLVNTGIQMGGIDEKIPDALSVLNMKTVTKFMTEQQRDDFSKCYTLVKKGEGDMNTFPANATMDLYMRTDADEKQYADACESYYNSTYAMLLMLKSQGENSNQSVDSEAGINAMTPEQVEKVSQMMMMVPQEKIQPYIDEAQHVDSMMKSSVSTTFTQMFYTGLGVDLQGIQQSFILLTGLKMLAVALLGVLAAVIVGFIAARLAASIAQTMRKDVFQKISGFTNAEFDKFSTASLITRTTNDVQQIQMLITMGLRIMCYAPIIGIGGIFMAVNKSLSLSWIIAVAVAVMLGMIIVILAVAMPKFTSLQKLIDKLNLVSRENLSGIMVIRAFGNEAFEEDRFENANKELAYTNRFVQRTMSFLMPAMMLIMNLVTLTIVWVGAKEISQSTLFIGDMMAFMQYAMQIIMAFLMIAMMFIMGPRALVSARRIQEVLSCEPTITDPKDPKPFTHVNGEVVFENVSFCYGDAQEKVLENISFTAHKGQTTAFIGATGSGKSTLINLIPRFYDVTGGRITIDGTDIREVTQHDLRNNIGYIPQKATLFSGTIASNVTYGSPEASEEEVNESIRVAQAQEFVYEKEEGIHSPIAQGGTNVSGGQKQRLSIARALTKKAPINIFDDSFSALDFKTDAALRRELKECVGDATILLVAQRVSTIMNADQIIVLDDGKIVGKGTHRALLASCPTYREIAESQLSKEELQ